jgi:uncharacterized radical SAM superfamily protein
MTAAENLNGWLTLPTSVLLNEAWRMRWRFFDNILLFAAPGAKNYENEYYSNNRGKFVTISVTGKECALKCEHCQMKLLATMLHCLTPSELLSKAENLHTNGCRGILLSGGADSEGAVPLDPFLNVIGIIKSWGLKVIVHTGLAKEDTIIGLKEAGVDQVLFDVIGDPQTIREVYHLEKEPEDYYNLLNLCLKYGLEAAPHIVIGLHFGKLRGEIDALKMISGMHVKRIVLVVITPLAGTPMAKIVPPSVEDCARLIAVTRLTNPESDLCLGCARPAGNQRHLLEQYALNAGVNGIAYPSPETIILAKEMGLEVQFSDQCCTLPASSLCD